MAGSREAGIRAESSMYVPSPIVIFIAKEHHPNVSYFSEVKQGDNLNVRVIGQRFELNDKYISIIGELIKDKENYKSSKQPIKIH